MLARCGVVYGLLILVAVSALAGTPAPQNLVLIDLNGKKVPLDSLLTKGPVVLNFWATWCGPCRTEMPQLQKVYQELAPRGVQFCAVSLDRKVSKSLLEQFLAKARFTVPVYRDEDATLARTFKVLAIPTTLVFAKGGDIHYQTRGYRPGDEILLTKKIEELLAGGKQATAAQVPK